MIYVTFDYRCKECGAQEERFVDRALMDVQWCRVGGCTSLMTRLPAGTQTIFKFADKSQRKRPS